MKKILWFVLTLFIFSVQTEACEGDCVVCHPNLVQENGKLDKDHEVLVTCKTCHTQEEMEKIDMGSGCGQDCWDCHDIKKVTASNVAEHRGLQKCIDCHVTIDRSMLGGTSAPAFTELPTLDDLMNSSIESGMIEVEETSIIEEMNKSDEVKVVTEHEEMGILDKIANFFKNIWQSIVSIFA
jgi:hypothetical protein